MANQMSDLKKFFSTEKKPVTGAEMIEFWKSLTDDEKEFYKTVEIG